MKIQGSVQRMRTIGGKDCHFRMRVTVRHFPSDPSYREQTGSNASVYPDRKQGRSVLSGSRDEGDPFPGFRRELQHLVASREDDAQGLALLGKNFEADELSGFPFGGH